LVGRQISLDATPLAAQLQYTGTLVSPRIQSPHAVVAVASRTTVLLKLGLVRCPAELPRGRCEVVHVSRRNFCNLPRWQRVVVGKQHSLGLGHVHGMVPYRAVQRIGKRIKLKVRVLREHQRSLRLRRGGVHDNPPRLLRQRVLDACLNPPWHAGRVCRIVDREGNGTFSHVGDIPEPVRPVVGPTVQRVRPVILLGMIRDAVNRKLSLSNTVCITPGNGVVHGVAGIDR